MRSWVADRVVDQLLKKNSELYRFVVVVSVFRINQPLAVLSSK